MQGMRIDKLSKSFGQRRSLFLPIHNLFPFSLTNPALKAYTEEGKK